MPRAPNSAWDDTILVGKYGTSGSKVVMCKFCGDVLRGSLTRITAHFTWTMGVGGHGCTRVPETVFYSHGGLESKWFEISRKLQRPLPQAVVEERLIKAIDEEGKQREVRDAKRRVQQDLADDNTVQYALPGIDEGIKEEAQESNKRARVVEPLENLGESYAPRHNLAVGISSPVHGCISPHYSIAGGIPSQVHGYASAHHHNLIHGISPQVHGCGVSRQKGKNVIVHGTQTTVSSWYGPKLKQELEIAEQQFFYQCNLAFDIARTPAYHRFYNALAACAAAGVSDLYPVNSRDLSTIHLKSQVKYIKSEFEGLKPCWQRYGCSIISNGWSYLKQRPMINVLVSCCVGTTLLQVVDASMPNVQITGEWIYGHICKAIEEVGPSNVVQVITDNSSDCASMGCMIEEKYPSIVWTPCASHSLDIMCQEIAKLPWIEPTLNKALHIIKFITKHKHALSMFRDICDYELVRPAKTRFGHLFLVLQRLTQTKDALYHLVSSEDWTAWKGSKNKKATKMKDYVLLDEFWKQAKGICESISPLYYLLQLFELEGCTMSLVYYYMKRLGYSIATCKSIPKDRVDDLNRIWNEKFDCFCKPIHMVAYMLHPFYNKLDNWNDRKLVSGWTSYIDRVYSTEECTTIEKESIIFSQNQDYFARPVALKEESRRQAVSWWEINGRLTPTLQKLALRTLSQDCTTLEAERIWSICADIHMKRRNRLSTSKLNDLVYVNANLRLLEKLRLADVNRNSRGMLQWKVRGVDASNIESPDQGLTQGDAIDISFVQRWRDENSAYDFLREDQLRLRKTTRARARATRNSSTVYGADAGVVTYSSRSRCARQNRASTGRSHSIMMREMMASDDDSVDGRSSSSTETSYSSSDSEKDVSRTILAMRHISNLLYKFQGSDSI